MYKRQFTFRESGKLRHLERSVKATFDIVPVPSQEEVMQCTTETTLERINMVHPDLIPHFLPVARSLISERGEEEALAATMASLCGYREPPARRSALTYEEGQVTLQMQDLTPGAYPLENTRDAARVLSQHLRTLGHDFGDVGKIMVLPPDKASGRPGTAFFDVPVSYTHLTLPTKRIV